MADNQRKRSKTAMAGLRFQVKKVERMLQREKQVYGYSVKTAIYLAAVLEYVVCELFESAALKTFEEGKKIVTGYHFVKGVANDALLYELLGGGKAVIAHKARRYKRPIQIKNKKEMDEGFMDDINMND